MFGQILHSLQRQRTVLLLATMLVVFGGVWLSVASTPVYAGLPASQIYNDDDGSYIYVVQSGDNWTTVSRRTGLSVAELQAANPQSVRRSGWLISGEKLTIPANLPGAPQTHTVAHGESWNSIAQKYDVSAKLLQAVNPRYVNASLTLYRGWELVIPIAVDGATPAKPQVTPTRTPTPVVDRTRLSTPTAETDSDTESGTGSETTAAKPAIGESEVGDTGRAADDAASEEADEAPAASASVRTETDSPMASEAEEAEASEGSVDAVAAEPARAPPEPAEEGAQDIEAEAIAETVACPEEFRGYPAFMESVLSLGESDVQVLQDRLDECGVLDEGNFTIADLTGDEADDLLVLYVQRTDDSVLPLTDLVVFVSEDGELVQNFRAKAAGQITLLAIEDTNLDGQTDLIWTDQTCGASTCFDTVSIRSWDGDSWVSWIDGFATMASATISLEEAGEDGQGLNLVLTGGQYGSFGAGPQRGFQEIWASIDGDPYTLIRTVFDPPAFLYHQVLDGNRSLASGADEGLETAQIYYEQALSDEDLALWHTDTDSEGAVSEQAQLRAFSLLRLAVIASYQGDGTSAAELIDQLQETYADSPLAEAGQVWLDALEESGSAVDACVVANVFAEENPESWSFLDEYGYANPRFTAEEFCPILDREMDEIIFIPGVGSRDADVDQTDAEDTGSGDADAEDTNRADEDSADVDAADVGDTEDPEGADTANEGETGATSDITPTVTITVTEPAVEMVLPDAQAEEEGITPEDTSDADTNDDSASSVGDAEGQTDTETASGPDSDIATLDLEDADTPACPVAISDFADISAQVLAISEGDPLIIETWLRYCRAMDDDRGAVLIADLNQDDIDDVVLFPTILSDTGFGPSGAEGTVLVYYGSQNGNFTLAVEAETYGQPAPLALDDINQDGRLDLVWTVESCATSCRIGVEILSWDGEVSVPGIVPGANVAEGEAFLEPVARTDPGSGQQLVLQGGVSGLPNGGLPVTRTEVWQSVDGQPYTRLRLEYDRENEASACLGLRLVEADTAMQASSLIGYEQAIQLYQQALGDPPVACTILDTPEEEELELLQGLGNFRLVQALVFNGETENATSLLNGFQQAQPDSGYGQIIEDWLNTYNETGDPAEACDVVLEMLEDEPALWQITDNYGIDHPVLAAEQVCFMPS